ncbi:MAG: VanZ family protein [Gammaproteobacteria bacterium]|nr:VanZ family protein [Gammaproteobacteria bacterium]
MRALRLRYLWLFGGITLVAMVLYLTLSEPGGGSGFINDKVAHFSAFAILMTWFCGVFEARTAIWVALALVVLGVGIELLQAQLPYRSAEVADGLYDFGGIAVGWLISVAGLNRWAVFIESVIGLKKA